MPDDLTKRRPQDAQRINIHEPYELRWWCAEFGVDAATLCSAVGVYGVMAKDVARGLGKPWHDSAAVRAFKL